MALSLSTTATLKFSRSLPAPLPILVITVLSLSALFLYAYSLRVAISFAVEREDIIENIATLRASLTSLDGQYVALTNGLSIEHAKSLGFHEVTDPLYISLSSVPSVVGLRSR